MRTANFLKSSEGFEDRDIRERYSNLAIVHGSTATKNVTIFENHHQLECG